VAVALVVIELVAFGRSPLRFLERRTTHDLGFAAVTTWRRWLVVTVGHWSARRWQAATTGDLLERALDDTDELQDVWVRAVVPVVGALFGAVTGDIVLALLTPFPHFVLPAVVLAAGQATGLAWQWRRLETLVRIDQRRREARGTFRAVALEGTSVAAELRALRRLHLVEDELNDAATTLAARERDVATSRYDAPVVATLTTVVLVALVALLSPHASAVVTALALLIALATNEALATVITGVATDVRVSAAAQRLDELSDEAPASLPWSGDATLTITDLVIADPAFVSLPGTRVVAAGRRVAITGPSGSGKSTLLRVLAGLDAPDRGTVTLGDVPTTALSDDARPLVYVPADVSFTDGLLYDALRLGRAVTRDLTEDLALLGLPTDETLRVTGWSRGESQRLAVVRALATDPAVVILDEPTSGLGADDVMAVTTLLARRGATVLVATHDPRLVAWCDEEWSLS
jgi:ABC-type transport system involved in cytochrome bd biosynthesis fused ATPase/permease subunit